MVRFPWILRAQGLDDPSEEPDRAGAGEGGSETPASRIVSGVVATVNLVQETCTLTDGTVVRIGEHAAEAVAALRGSARVLLDAEGHQTDQELLATEVWIRAE